MRVRLTEAAGSAQQAAGSTAAAPGPTACLLPPSPRQGLRGRRHASAFLSYLLLAPEPPPPIPTPVHKHPCGAGFKADTDLSVETASEAALGPSVSVL